MKWTHVITQVFLRKTFPKPGMFGEQCADIKLFQLDTHQISNVTNPNHKSRPATSSVIVTRVHTRLPALTATWVQNKLLLSRLDSFILNINTLIKTSNQQEKHSTETQSVIFRRYALNPLVWTWIWGPGWVFFTCCIISEKLHCGTHRLHQQV